MGRERAVLVTWDRSWRAVHRAQHAQPDCMVSIRLYKPHMGGGSMRERGTSAQDTLPSEPPTQRGRTPPLPKVQAGPIPQREHGSGRAPGGYP